MIKFFKILFAAHKLAYQLEAAWYAMEKHAPIQCRREIHSARKVLNEIGYLD